MRRLLCLISTSIILLLNACGGSSTPNANYLHEDDVRFAADASFEPIVQELSDLFNARHPEATMLPLYCNEDSAIRLLVRDSLRMVITTRKLTENEKALIQKRNCILIEILRDNIEKIKNRLRKNVMFQPLLE